MSPEGPTPPPPAAAAEPDDGIHIYRRNTATRMIGVAAAVLFLSGAISSLVLSGPGIGSAALALFALLGLVNLATSWGDRLILDAGGIEQRNLLLAHFGLRPRRLAWHDIAEAREHRGPGSGQSSGPPRAVVLVPRSGRRMVLDSFEHYEEIIRAVTERAPSNRTAASEQVPGAQ